MQAGPRLQALIVLMEAGNVFTLVGWLVCLFVCLDYLSIFLLIRLLKKLWTDWWMG